MDITCIDSDDDNIEFDDADEEEYEDVTNKDVSAYMIAKNNISKY